MICVLWGHSIQYCSVGAFDFFENPVFRFIYSFHMPLFIIISGYSFYWTCMKELKCILMKQIKGIGIPLIVWNTIQWMFYSTWDLLKGNGMSLGSYIKCWISNMYGLWFLWSVLIFSIVVAVGYKKASTMKGRLLLWFCGWLLMIILPGAIEPSKNCNIWLFPYFLGAFLFHCFEGQIKNEWKFFKYIMIPLYPLMLVFFHSRDYIYISGINPFSSKYGVITQIGIDLFRWGIGVVGSMFIITIVQWIYKKSQQHRIWDLLCMVGKSTLQLYVMQRLLLETIFSMIYTKIVIEIGYNPLTQSMVLYNMIWTPIVCFVALVFMMVVLMQINKMGKISRMLFGRG